MANVRNLQAMVTLLALVIETIVIPLVALVQQRQQRASRQPIRVGDTLAGVVKWFDGRGFGYIMCSESTSDFFFHARDCEITLRQRLNSALPSGATCVELSIPVAAEYSGHEPGKKYGRVRNVRQR